MVSEEVSEGHTSELESGAIYAINLQIPVNGPRLVVLVIPDFAY